MVYRYTAVWGAHEGSLLLWALILAVWTAAVARFSQRLPPEVIARVLGVMGLVAVGFLAFLLFTSNPFERISDAARRPRPQPAAAGPGDDHPSADAVPGLRRVLGAVRVRDRRVARRQGRRALAALDAPVDERRVGLPHHRHRAGFVVGVLRTRLGRLVVLGSGRERELHAVARRRRAAAFAGGHRKARQLPRLDLAARHRDVLAVAARHLPRAFGRADQRACLRRRSRRAGCSS